MQIVLFQKSHDIKNKLLIIIRTGKMSDKKRHFFLRKNLLNPQKQKVTL
jgi:hypothetical protein